MTNNNLKLAVTAALLAGGQTVLAQSATTYIRPAYTYPLAPPVSGAASVQLGETPLFFTPYLGVAAGHDDNLFLSNVNKKASALYIGTAGFGIDARSAN